MPATHWPCLLQQGLCVNLELVLKVKDKKTVAIMLGNGGVIWVSLLDLGWRLISVPYFIAKLVPFWKSVSSSSLRNFQTLFCLAFIMLLMLETCILWYSFLFTGFPNDTFYFHGMVSNWSQYGFCRCIHCIEGLPILPF